MAWVNIFYSGIILAWLVLLPRTPFDHLEIVSFSKVWVDSCSSGQHVGCLWALGHG